MSAKISRECDAGRILCPFEKNPLLDFKCSGVGVVPKKNGKWRMIYHLSVPRGQSINNFIDLSQYTLHYGSVDDAIRCISKIGKRALMAKLDLKAAFRMVPVRKEDWELLGIHWQGHYYVDTHLPFGLRSAPYLFNQFDEALHWILTNYYAIPNLTTTAMII